jgi:hypothetical protein
VSGNQQVLERMVELIGYDRVQLLCRELTGLQVYFPQAPSKKLRDKEIRRSYERLLGSGHSIEAISSVLAKQHGLTARHVRRIVNQEPDQQSEEN